MRVTIERHATDDDVEQRRVRAEDITVAQVHRFMVAVSRVSVNHDGQGGYCT